MSTLRKPTTVNSLQASSRGTPSYFQGSCAVGGAGGGQIDQATGFAYSFPLLITNGITAMTCAIIPGVGGAGHIEYSISPPDQILDDTAWWWCWPAGTVSEPFCDLLQGPVTAIRAVSIAGSVSFEIVGC